MEIEWFPVHSRTNNRTLEVQATARDLLIEIWSYRIDLEVRYYFTILKFQTVDNISIGKRITQFLDFAEGFNSLEQYQDFVKKNWDVL